MIFSKRSNTLRFEFKSTLLLVCIVLAGSCLSTRTEAGEKAIVANCTGSGAYFYISDVSFEAVEAAALNAGAGLAPSRDAVLVTGVGGTRWDTRPRGAIDHACGGDGKDEIAFFKGLQPKSGLWKAHIGATKMDGCPPMMQKAFPMSPGALPAEWQAPRRLTFETPFHPDQLEMTKRLKAEGLGSLKWQTAGEDAWSAEVFSQLFNQIPKGQGQGSKLVWKLTVASEERIEHLSTVQIALPTEVAAIMGSAPNCRVTSHNSWVRVGD